MRSNLFPKNFTDICTNTIYTILLTAITFSEKNAKKQNKNFNLGKSDLNQYRDQKRETPLIR